MLFEIIVSLRCQPSSHTEPPKAKAKTSDRCMTSHDKTS